jgi:hypothetical protein
MNPRFAVGYPIKLLWETDAEPVELSLLQFSDRGGGMKSLDGRIFLALHSNFWQAHLTT